MAISTQRLIIIGVLLSIFTGYLVDYWNNEFNIEDVIPEGVKEEHIAGVDYTRNPDINKGVSDQDNEITQEFGNPLLWIPKIFVWFIRGLFTFSLPVQGDWIMGLLANIIIMVKVFINIILMLEGILVFVNKKVT